MASPPFDPTLKILVEVSAVEWPGLLRQPEAPVRIIDADLGALQTAADKVLLVESDPPYLLHLEFHAGHDGSTLPPLLLLRNVLLHHRHRLPVRTGVIILRPEADARALSGVYEQTLTPQPPHLHFEYEVLRLWQVPVGQLLNAGIAGLLLAPLSDVTEAEVPAIIERVKKRLGRRDLQAQAAELWEGLRLLLGLRFNAAQRQTLLRGITKMKESSAYQETLEEGRTAGQLQEARQFLLRIGSKKLGVAGAAVVARVQAIADLALLEALGERLLTVRDWNELLGTEKPPRRGRRS